MPKYITKTQCFHKGIFYKPDDPYIPTGDELEAYAAGTLELPEHFIKIEDPPPAPEPEPEPKLEAKEEVTEEKEPSAPEPEKSFEFGDEP
jgi:hypothetical protein